MLAGCEILEIPVLTTEQYPKALGNSCGELEVKRFGPVYEKTAFSMLSEHVKPHLEKKESVILVGIESHICVLQTALDLRRLDKRVFVIRDGISSINKNEISIAVERMRQAGCIITTSESILFELVEDSKHPRFKDISALIREFKDQTAQGMKACL
jgi:Isochorismatase family